MASQKAPAKNTMAPKNVKEPVRATTPQSPSHEAPVNEQPSIQTASADVQTSTLKRNMSGTRKILTDLFKLTVANVIKQVGIGEHPESHPTDFHSFEHTHPFRTYDKKGAKQTQCTPIAGHFHIVEWNEPTHPDEPPTIKSISKPMVMEKKKVRGKILMVPVEANDWDDHTHEAEYIRTDEIQFSTTNIEAAKVMAMEATKTAPVPGVIG